MKISFELLPAAMTPSNIQSFNIRLHRRFIEKWPAALVVDSDAHIFSEIMVRMITDHRENKIVFYCLLVIPSFSNVTELVVISMTCELKCMSISPLGLNCQSPVGSKV